MIEVHQTAEFRKWFGSLRDRHVRSRIDMRIARLADGNSGDVAPVGEGVSEMRIHYGPGYRVYFVQRADILVILLCGGDKGSQSRDIEMAKALARELRG